MVEPTHIAALSREGVPVIAVAGWPTGRHHSVIKAAEARLAAESGAGEIWLAVDREQDATALLADVIAVRQAVVAPARLGLIYTGAPAQSVAATAGLEVLAVPAGVQVPDTELEVAVFGGDPDVDAVVEALETGASRVYPSIA